MEPSPDVTHLYLIRHGEAVSNVEPIVGGMEGDQGLTERGVRQVERLRDRLKASGEITAEVVIASTMPRARQTAEILAPAFGPPIQWDEELHELRPGQADSLTHEEFRRRYGWPDFWAEPFTPLAPGAETWGGFMLRVASALHRITSEHAGRQIVLICHGGVVDGSFVYFMNLPVFHPPAVAFDTRNTSITHWDELRAEGQPTRWRLRRYNDAEHLRGMES